MWCGPRKMLELKAEFDGLVENELHRSNPAIRVGIQQRRAISIVPEVLQHFMEKYPDVEVIFRDGNQAELMKMFQEGSVDYIISVCSEEIPDVVRTEIARERVLLALPEYHPAIAHAYQVEMNHIRTWICDTWTGKHLLFRWQARACV